LTKDSVSITVDAVMYFRVNKVADAKYGTSLLAATTLRNTLGTKTLQEIFIEKENISHRMQEILDVTNTFFVILFFLHFLYKEF